MTKAPNICNYYPVRIWDNDGINARFKLLFDTVCFLKAGGGGGGGVTALNGLTGNVTLVPGTNITFSTTGDAITINASGGSGSAQNLQQTLTEGNLNGGIPALGTLLLQTDNPFGSIVLANSVGQPIINTDNTDNLTILDAAAFLSANFGARILTDPTGANSIGWNSRILYDAAGDSILDWSTGAIIVNDVYSLPTTDGTLGQVMKTNGSGTLTWQDPDTGGSPSWQDTLINSSTLLQDNVITGGGRSFIWNNASYFEIDTDAFIIYNSNQTVPLLTITPTNISFNTENVSSFLTFSVDVQGAYYHQSNDSTTSNTIFQQSADGGLNTYVINGGNVFNGIQYDSAGIGSVGYNDGTTQFTAFSWNDTGLFTINGAYTLPNIDGTANYVLTTDGSGVVTWQPSGGGSVTADNGLNISTGTNVQMGGPLTGYTTIDANTFNLTLTTSAAVSTPLTVNSDSYIALQVTSISGNALEVISNTNTALSVSSGTGQAAGFGINPATTNAIETIISMRRSTSGTGANGIGASLDLYVSTDSSSELSNQLISKWSNATQATRTSQFVISGVNSTVTSDLFTLNGNGKLQLNKYGLGTFTGTPAYTLQVDASGNIIEGTGISLSGTYTPTLSNTTNVTSSTPIICHYVRVGNQVTVTGSVGVVTTLAVATILGISLPIASNFASVTDASGVGQASSAIAANAFVQANTSTDVAELRFIGLSIGGSGNIYFTFTYTII